MATTTKTASGSTPGRGLLPGWWHTGPVSEFVPGSILQQARTDFTMLGGVAADLEISMA
jgi:hypothetical protein